MLYEVEFCGEIAWVLVLSGTISQPFAAFRWRDPMRITPHARGECGGRVP